jgi:hypothetical protein
VFNICVNIRHPGWCERFENVKCLSGPVTKWKFWEVEIIKNDNLLRFEFSFTTQTDHAGINLELGLLGYEIHFTFYDSRHWNSETNSWQVYD